MIVIVLLNRGPYFRECIESVNEAERSQVAIVNLKMDGGSTQGSVGGGFDTTYQGHLCQVDLRLRLERKGFATVYIAFARLVVRGDLSSPRAQDPTSLYCPCPTALLTDPIYKIDLPAIETEPDIQS
jgi:GT2 family glycosyltransferase